MPFRLASKNAFLTYPQIGEPISAEDAGLRLSTIAGPTREYIAVAVALHEDGGHHLHVLITFKVGCHAVYVFLKARSHEPFTNIHSVAIH